MATVQITIPDALAKEAAAEGLLEPGRIEATLRERLAAVRVAKMQAMRFKFSPSGTPPMTAEDSCQLVAIPEEVKSDAPRSLRLEIGQDIDVATSRIEVVAEHGTEHAQANDAPVAAEGHHAVTVELDWQFLDVGNHLAGTSNFDRARR